MTEGYGQAYSEEAKKVKKPKVATKKKPGTSLVTTKKKPGTSLVTTKKKLRNIFSNN